MGRGVLKRRTDLAMEAKTLWEESAEKETRLEGVEARDTEREGYKVTTVRILNERGAAALEKPVGNYVTLLLDGLARREANAFGRAARALGGELRALLKLPDGASALVVGLGNRAITPDAVGPKAAEHTMVTRHLVERVPEHFGSFRPVAALAAGTGRGGEAQARLRPGGGRSGLPEPGPGLPDHPDCGHGHCPRLGGGQRPGRAEP